MLSITAYATEALEEEPIYQAEYSELEQLVQLRSMSENELSQLGFSAKQIDTIQNLDIEGAVMDRASLSKEQLIALGHTQNDIVLLKAYNGERIAENSPVIAASPTCSGSIVKVNLSNNGYAIKFKYTFTWSACPFFQHTDKVALKWVAANESGNVQCIITSRSGLVNYYSDISGTRVETVSKTPSEEDNNTFSGRQFSYEVSIPYSDPSIANWIWAKSGSMTIQLEPLANSSQSSTPVQISAVDAYGAVGHQYSGLNIEIGISDNGESSDVSFSFTPTENVQKTGIAHYIIPKDGSATPAL